MKKIIFILLPVLVLAGNYVLKKDVLSAGGRKMASTNYILQGTISQTTIGNAEDTDYKAVIGFWHPPEAVPPLAPYITQAEKSANSVHFTWSSITTDTLGNPEIMNYYVVYRDTAPSFVPGTSDSIGYVLHPDTEYTDLGALDSTESYHYLVKAVDWAKNRSKKSNMGYKFNRFINWNTDRASRNWVSLPCNSEYSHVSDLVADLSPSGDPLESVTNLRDDQVYETWLWDPVL